MTLKEKFDCVVYNEYGIDTKQCELIAEEFAIGFTEWVECSKTYYTPMKELLEIYKKENQL